MDYRRELRKMERHRDRCLSVIPRLMYMHGSHDGNPVPITELDFMTRVLELLDLGYLDRDAFPVAKSGGIITSLHYNGRFPLTMEGDLKYRHYLEIQRETRLRRVIILSALAAISAAALLLLNGME